MIFQFFIHRLGELQLSIEAYDQAILLDSFFIEAYIGRGNVHMDYLTPGRIAMSKSVLLLLRACMHHSL